MRLWHWGGVPGASTSALCQAGWWSWSSRALRDSLGFSRSSCSSALRPGRAHGTSDASGDTPAVPLVPPRWVTVALTDALGDVLAGHADTQHHGEAARGTAPRGAQGPTASPRQCPHAGAVPTAVSPRQRPHRMPHQLTRAPEPGRAHARTSGFSPSGTLSWVRATTTGCPLGHGERAEVPRRRAGTPQPCCHPGGRDGHSQVH